LPRVPAPPPPPYKKPAGKKLPVGTETILVLEDDISVRHISVRVLRKLGYQVIEAANADDARRLISENGGHKIDLLLTDMVMPQKVSGVELAEKLLAQKPDLKVIFTSGYTVDEISTDFLRRNNHARFLQKPYHRAVLARAVRHALDGAAPPPLDPTPVAPRA
jgi:DNA-binding NtrC family response regulator